MDKENLWSGTKWYHVVIATFSLWLLWLKLEPSAGNVGHDYVYHLTRLTIGTFHFWQNGLAIPYFTASLCGGIPLFPDPQLIYYSLPQWLAFGMDPMLATQIAYAVFYVLGYLGAFVVGRRVLQLGAPAAHLAALIFLLNGFTFAQFYVGHATHHAFLLFPWILFGVFAGGTGAKRREVIPYAALVALILLYCVWGGGAHILIVTIPFLILLAPWWISEHKQEGRVKDGIVLLAVTLAITLLLASPKLWATFQYKSYFASRGMDLPASGTLGLIWDYFWPSSTAEHFVSFGEYNMGSWEIIGFVSRLVIPSLLWLVFVYGQKNIFIVVRYGVVALIVLLMAGGSFANASLPLLKDYHLPIKLLCAFLPFMALAVGLAAQRAREWHRYSTLTSQVRGFAWIALSLAIVLEFSFNSQFIQQNPEAAKYHLHENYFAAMKRIGQLPKVTEITTQNQGDDLNVLLGKTSLACYEPVFGYKHEALKAKVKAGPTETISDSAFNLTHPGCFLFPEYLKCNAWDRIPASQRELFEKFRSGESVTEWVPDSFRLATTLSILAIFALALACAWHFLEPLRSILGRKRSG